MKIGIVSCYFINNYGSILQAYALQEYFGTKGIECDTVSVEGLKPYLDAQKRQYYFHNIHKAGLIFSKLPMIYLKALRKSITEISVLNTASACGNLTISEEISNFQA